MSRGALAARLLHVAGEAGVPVESPSSDQVPESFELASEFGSVLAQFHSAVEGFVVPEGARWTQLSRGTLMGADAGWIARLYHDDPDRGDLLADWRQRAVDALATAPRDDVGVCHGEAYPATCRNVEGGRMAIAELDWAGVGHRAYDLATFRWVLELHAGDAAEPLFDDFLAGYGARRPLPPLDGLRAWVAARHLWSLRLAAGFADADGLARRAAFAATWTL